MCVCTHMRGKVTLRGQGDTVKDDTFGVSDGCRCCQTGFTVLDWVFPHLLSFTLHPGDGSSLFQLTATSWSMDILPYSIIGATSMK